MPGNQVKRFERWRQRALPEPTREFVARILDEIVPIFRQNGYKWHADYAEGSPHSVPSNCIPLQQRGGNVWPTVELQFNPSRRPLLGIFVARLGNPCLRRTRSGSQLIFQSQASVTEGEAYFSLCKGESKNYDCSFGYDWFALRPMARIASEIEKLESLLPLLFDVLSRDFPDDWMNGPARYVHRHFFRNPNVGFAEEVDTLMQQR